MAISKSLSSLVLPLVLLVVVFPVLSHAFGAGNIASISKIEGQNWRHGDIEDTLLNIVMAKVAGGKKFSKLNIQRVYFGNWLRDYSQAIDVGTVKHVPAEAIRIILWVLGFLSFGYGTKEFEVTRDRLGCYRPEEHIDNPKDYADNVDARHFDPRLRGPVNEQVELAIDHRTGMKMYIAAEDKGITTSAGMIRDLFGRCIYLGRQYGRTKNKDDLYEALRLLGTGTHCLEDFSAHSNYVELALRNCGEEMVFPHVGRNTAFQLDGVNHGVWPIVTGTFGGVDFLHSVMGEFSDHMTQSELQQLEGTVQGTQNQGNSTRVKELINQMPSGVFGGKDEAAKADELEANAAAARMNNMNINQRDPAAIMQQLGDISKQIYPIMEFHDDLFKSINSAIEYIPILPGLIEKLQESINVYVFSLIAPLLLPVISQVKQELNVGSSEIIKSSKEKQMIVFRDDNATDPTHSMLSKDHFTNVLNEPAGKVASQVLKWVVPQIMACWDDERIDVNRTLNRIITGVFHHPVLRHVGKDGASDCRQLMFKVVERWWREKSEGERQTLRGQLSREGVEQGKNHKAGAQDSGHGGCQAIHIPQNQGNYGTTTSNPVGNFLGAVGLPDPLAASTSFAASGSSGFGKFSSLAGGGLVGGLLGGVGSKLLGKTFGKKQDEVYDYQQQTQHADGSNTTAYTETAHRPQDYGQPEKYGQAEYQQTTYPAGGYKQDYQRFEQDGHGGTQGYGFHQSEEVKPSYGGGYDQTTQQQYTLPGGQWESQTQHDHIGSEGQHEAHEVEHQGKKFDHKNSDSESNSGPESDDDPYGDPDKKERKRLKRERKRQQREERRARKHAQQQHEAGGGFDQYPRPSSPHLNPLASSGFYGTEPQDTSGNYSSNNFAYAGAPPPPPPEWNDGQHPYGPPSGGPPSWYGSSQQPMGYGQQAPPPGGYNGGQRYGGYGNQGPPPPPPGQWGGQQGYEADEQSGGGGFPGAHGHGAQGHGGGRQGGGGGWYGS